MAWGPARSSSDAYPFGEFDIDALTGLQRADTRFADRRGGVTVPRRRAVDVYAGPDGVDPPLDLDVVGSPEPFPEARRDPAAPETGSGLAHEPDVQTDGGAAEFAHDLGAHLIGDARGDEDSDVDVPPAARPQDRDLRALQAARRAPVRDRLDDLHRGDLLAQQEARHVGLVHQRVSDHHRGIETRWHRGGSVCAGHHQRLAEFSAG